MTATSERLQVLCNKTRIDDEFYTRREDIDAALDHVETRGHKLKGLRIRILFQRECEGIVKNPRIPCNERGELVLF